MFTNHFKKFMQTMVASVTSNTHYDFSVKTTNGLTVYPNWRKTGFPEQITHAVQTNFPAAGIFIGSGTKAEAANDYFLENAILSGFQTSLVKTTGLDNGKPYIQFVITITNTSGSPMSINEIGFAQTISCSTSSGGSSYTYYPILFDRTKLDSTLEIAAGDTGLLTYKLLTSL